MKGQCWEVPGPFTGHLVHIQRHRDSTLYVTFSDSFPHNQFSLVSRYTPHVRMSVCVHTGTTLHCMSAYVPTPMYVTRPVKSYLSL